MDDTTRKMLLTLGAGLLKKGGITLGTAWATHGWISGNDVELVGAGAVALGSAAYSFWNDYGKAIVLSQLDVLKAKSLAQADQARKAGLPPVTVDAIADKSPTLTSTDVAKVVAKLLIAAFVLTLFLAGDPAMAQAPKLTGNIVNDIRARAPVSSAATSDRVSTALSDIIGALDAKLLPDLQYALKLANASGSRVTAPCYQAWIDIITVRQKAVTDDQGNPLPMPDPALISNFEKVVELRNALQPDSDFMIKCSPVASMVKKDITGFIGLVISGGAGLATLVPGL